MRFARTFLKKVPAPPKTFKKGGAKKLYTKDFSTRISQKISSRRLEISLPQGNITSNRPRDLKYNCANSAISLRSRFGDALWGCTGFDGDFEV